MIYGFRCDCGAHAMEEFSIDDPEKKIRCPKCGDWMWRDFSSVSIGGDLPTRRPGWQKNGYVQGDMGAEDRLLGEVEYIDKHAGPREQVQANQAINRMGSEFRDKQRKEAAQEKFRNLKVEIPKGFDL